MSDLRTRAAEATKGEETSDISDGTGSYTEPVTTSRPAPAAVELDETIAASDETVAAHVAFSRVMGDVQYVAKTRPLDDRGRPVSGGLNYAFRGIDALLDAVGPALRKHGGMFVPTKVVKEHDQVPTSGGKMMQRCRVTVTYGFVGPKGDVFPLPIESAGEAFDSGDKATPKAMSVSLRTAYIQAFAIPTNQPEMDPEHGPQYEVVLPPPPTVAQYVGWVKDPSTSLGRLRQMRTEINEHNLAGAEVEGLDGEPTTLIKLVDTIGRERAGAQA